MAGFGIVFKVLAKAEIMARKKKEDGFFEKFAGKVTYYTGRPSVFFSAAGLVLLWAVLGPVFGFSDTWQLVINTSTTIITFLMVFVIQQSQNKDTMALQLKLNELVAANKLASNRLIDVEDLSEEELETLKKYYIKLSDLAEKEKDIFSSHSIDEAKEKHEEKSGKTTRPRKK